MKSQNYKNVQIFGPFNSGTNLLARIIRYGLTEQINMKTAGGTHICKHTVKANVLEETVKKNKETLFICMYRPAIFWIESMKNNLYDLEWDTNIKNPCILRDVKYETIFHLHKTYYEAYKKICSKYSNVIWLEYNILINKEIAYQYLNNKLAKTNLTLKSKEKITSILEKPTKNPNKEYGRNCDQALSYLQQLKQKTIENRYTYILSPEISEFFELGI